MLEKHKAGNLVNHLDLLSVTALEMKATLCYLNKNIPDREQVILRSTLKDLEQAIRALE